MKNLKIFFLAVVPVLVWSANAFSQSGTKGALNGSVIDSVGSAAVAYATVALMDDEKLVSGTTADQDGMFVISDVPLGTYTLTVSFTGYISKTVPVTLTSEKPLPDLETIPLVQDTRMLNELVVVGEKSLIEDKGDRLVYNAEKDISNAGGTAADVLRKVPTLTVDLEGNVRMRGNGNIKVLINGKPSTMMARNLKDALRQMPANLIKSVEVINSPGAKYDAEGSAGVINIITKKGMDGFNGSANVTAGNFDSGLGTNLSYRRNKLGVSMSLSGYQYRSYYKNNSVRTSYDTTAGEVSVQSVLNQYMTSDNTGRGATGEMSIDYDIDSTSRVNFAANIWGGKYPSNSYQTNYLYDAQGDLVNEYRNDSKFLNPYGNGQLDFGYTKTLKKPEQELSFLGQFSRMPDNYFYNTTQTAGSGAVVARQQSINYSRNKEYTFQSDYTHPIKINGRKDTSSTVIEVGVKGIYRDIGSEFRVAEALGEEAELADDPTQSNVFDYVQKVYSAYASMRFNNRQKWNLNTGLRLEHTDIEGNFVSTGTKLSSDYTNVIPSVTLSKGIKTHTFRVSYNQRIQRPMIWVLNPWENKSDPKNIWTGNPNLNPELSHAAEIGHSVNTEKGTSVNSALYVRYVNNAIDYLSTIGDSSVVTRKPENFSKRTNYGANLNIAGKPVKGWEISGGGDLSYLQIANPVVDIQTSGIVWNVNFNTSYKLPKGFSVQANGSYSSGWINLMQTSTGFYWHGFSGKYQFMKEKANLILTFSNPFYEGVSQEREQKAPTFVTNHSSFYITRSVRVNFEWRFGQMNEGGGKRSKKITNDDRGGR